MFSQVWWKKYGLLAKLYLVLVFFLLLNGQVVFLGIWNQFNFQRQLPTAKYDSYIQGMIGGNFIPNTPECDDWLRRKQLARQEIDQIVREITAQGANYTRVDYFHNLDRVMQLEDKYQLQLMGGSMLPFEAVFRASLEALRNEQPITPEQAAYIQKIQDRHAIRNGDSPVRSAVPINWLTILAWLVTKYLWLMLFWGGIYLVRFLERDKSIRLFQRHHHELNKFIDDQENFPGRLSLKDELLLCPERFISRLVFWPLFCWHYPHHESPAALVRYLGLKTHLLKYKPFGYQLSDTEDALLRFRARARVKNFDQAVKELFSVDKTATLVKKSLLLAQLSLVFGVLFQPAIVLAAEHSQTAAKHFYSCQVLLAQVQQNQHQLAGPDPPSHDFQPDWPAILPSPINCQPVFNLLCKIVLEFRAKLPLVVFDIEHIPLLRVVSAVRC